MYNEIDLNNPIHLMAMPVRRLPPISESFVAPTAFQPFNSGLRQRARENVVKYFPNHYNKNPEKSFEAD
jgi:hypothetical protein